MSIKSQVSAGGSFARIDMVDADVSFFKHMPFSIPDEVVFQTLLRDTVWLHREVTVYGKRHMQPRLTAWYGDRGKVYAYSGVKLDPVPWTELLNSLRLEVEELTAARYNSVLLNLYRDHNDRMGFHADNEASLGREPTIASLSYGTTRTLIFKHRNPIVPQTKILLPSGSLLLMRGATQNHWHHGINRETRPSGPRINLTFRQIVK